MRGRNRQFGESGRRPSLHGRPGGWSDMTNSIWQQPERDFESSPDTLSRGEKERKRHTEAPTRRNYWHGYLHSYQAMQRYW